MNRRAEFSSETKRLAAERADGHCEAIWNGKRCNMPLRRGEHVYDHRDPDFFSKDNSLENCQVICTPCDRVKYPIDRKNIDKSKRLQDRDRGIRPAWRQKLPFGRDSNLKQKVNRTVVDRRTGEKPVWR